MTELLLAETDDDLIVRCSAAVYNRELLRSCGHVVTQPIAAERGKIYQAMVRTALSEAGVIAAEEWPAATAVLDESGYRLLMQERKAKKGQQNDAA